MVDKVNSIVVYAPSGAGKTHLVAQAMPNALWILTNKTNLMGYDTYIQNNPEEAAALGMKPVNARLTLQPKQIGDDGTILDVDIRDQIDGLMREFAKKVKEGTAKVQGVVFDEFNIIAEWVHNFIKNHGSKHAFDASDQLRTWFESMTTLSMVTGQPFCFICHKSDPTFHEEKDSPMYGQVKYKGGPTMPQGKMIEKIAGLPDLVVELGLKAKSYDQTPIRRLYTGASPFLVRKCRVNGTPNETEPDLRPILAASGWTF